MAASSTSLADNPLGWCVVQRMKVVLKTWKGQSVATRKLIHHQTMQCRQRLTLDHSGWWLLSLH